jgi:hypothetical protein
MELSLVLEESPDNQIDILLGQFVATPASVIPYANAAAASAASANLSMTNAALSATSGAGSAANAAISAGQAATSASNAAGSASAAAASATSAAASASLVTNAAAEVFNAGPTFTGSITGNSLAVSGVTGTIALGQVVYGAGVTPGTTITAGAGTSWTVSPSQTVTSEAMGAASATQFAPGFSTSVTLAGSYGSINNLLVTFDDGVQRDCTLAGNILSFNPNVPIGISQVVASGGRSLAIGVTADVSVTDAKIAPGSRIYIRINNEIWAQDKGAVGDGVHDDTVALNSALATGKRVRGTSGIYKVTAPLNMVGNGGLIADGESFVLQRNFNGGPLINYAGGIPIILDGIQLSTNPSITPVAGDDGTNIGLTEAWGGRGFIGNMLITGQNVGFRWKGGTVGAIQNVQCFSNLSHGFQGDNAAQILDMCCSELNVGNGFYFNTTQVNQGNPEMRNCTAFANNGAGYKFNAIAAIGQGANVFMTDCVSSYDNGGGVIFSGSVGFVQIHIKGLEIEYAGSAFVWHPAFAQNPNAVGLAVLAGANILTMDDVFVNTSQGAGAIFNLVAESQVGKINISNSNQGGLGGSNAVGLSLSQCAGMIFTGLQSDTGGNQTTDISVSTGCTNIQFAGSSFRTYFSDGTNSVKFIGRSPVLGPTTIASASSVAIPDNDDFIKISGTTTINNLTSSSALYGRTITLCFTGTLTVANGGNIKLLSAFSAAPNATLTLIADGTNWYGK